MAVIRFSLAAMLLLAATAADAATLQISPVTVDFLADQSAAGITLRNPGNQPLYGQVRVFRWDQSNGADTLTPSAELIASPPLIRIAAQAEQLVRLVHPTPAAVAQSTEREQSFRVLIDEIPQADASPTSGVNLRLRYSVPVFIAPAGAEGQPELAWHLVHGQHGWLLHIDNAGARHAQIAVVRLVNGAGRVYPIEAGLLGYALAGRGREWQVKLPPDADLSGTVKVEAMVNARPLETAVQVEQRP